MQDAAWYKVTEQLIRSCKTTVGYLLQGHQYQFRVLAKNAHGFSEPSDPSPLITIGSLTSEFGLEGRGRFFKKFMFMLAVFWVSVAEKFGCYSLSEFWDSCSNG